MPSEWNQLLAMWARMKSLSDIAILIHNRQSDTISLSSLRSLWSKSAMGRAPCCDKASVKKGPWSLEEDAKLRSYIEQHGTGGNWIVLPQKIGLKRCGKSCRLRWLNYLRPNIKHGGFSEEEDGLICSLYVSIGSRWSIIAAQLPGRTDNDIKNYWNTRLKKKLLGKQRKERDRQGNNNDIRKGGLKNSMGSISGRENQIDCPYSFVLCRNQITPTLAELPMLAQTTPTLHSDLEDRTKVFNRPLSFDQYYPIGQSSPSPPQNPNYVHGASVAMVSPATIAALQLGDEQGGKAFPCTAEETQLLANHERPFDRADFLLDECIDAACPGAASVNWYDMINSMVYLPSLSYGLGTQNGAISFESRIITWGKDNRLHTVFKVLLYGVVVVYTEHKLWERRKKRGKRLAKKQHIVPNYIIIPFAVKLKEGISFSRKKHSRWSPMQEPKIMHTVRFNLAHPVKLLNVGYK
ncbi:hypothetical protein SAY86_027913 [Trapa natans]|uniref:Uncharacterized protein n=1 Tax=Trapa natans TaxID=22666 RepID=A0AAN7RA89_TRANT|nr:hypothetical protein SAY86_027913 [Trapa natans]